MLGGLHRKNISYIQMERIRLSKNVGGYSFPKKRIYSCRDCLGSFYGNTRLAGRGGSNLLDDRARRFPNTSLILTKQNFVESFRGLIWSKSIVPLFPRCDKKEDNLHDKQPQK